LADFACFDLFASTLVCCGQCLLGVAVMGEAVSGVIKDCSGGHYNGRILSDLLVVG